jgi:hypothetical protein
MRCNVRNCEIVCMGLTTLDTILLTMELLVEAESMGNYFRRTYLHVTSVPN